MSIASLVNSEDERDHPSSAHSPAFAGVDASGEEDERVRLAIEALGAMRTASTPAPTVHGPYRTGSSNTTSSGGPITPSTSAVSLASSEHSHSSGSAYVVGPDGEVLITDAEDPRFLERVSQLPIVSGALRAYEGARNSNRAIKYSTDVIGSGVKTISRPVVRCSAMSLDLTRQLGRFNQSPASAHQPIPVEDEVPWTPDASAAQLPSVEDDDEDMAPVEGEHGAVVHAPRSRWQALVIEAGLTAGGIGAAVSEEGLKSLRYCLQWLQYASARMDQQVLALRDIIVHVANGTPTDGAGTESRAVVALDEIKRDVVDTIRRVVEVVSTYAGAALPENARRFVRQSILSLPVRWTQSMSASDAPTTPTGAGPEGHRSAANAAAERLMVFAVESLDMLRSLTQIFGDSAERAELWLDRLKIVGLAQRQREAAAVEAAPLDHSSSASSPSNALTAPPETLRHRGAATFGATQSHDVEMEL